MTTNVYINLAVKNLKKANEFFKQLGFEFNSKYSDENATCMILNDKAYVMLLQDAFFKTFTRNPISNAYTTTEVLIAIEQNSRKAVDSFIEKAISLGAKEARDTQELGFMYSRSFHDLDGHIWEVGWMDESAMK